MVKNIQFGEREVISPSLKMSDQRLCPVTAFEKLMALNIKQFNGALFTQPSGSCITYHLFQKKFRQCIDEIGLESKHFSTHSFRRGFTTLAFRSDIPPEYIQLLGDWKSDAYKCYLQLDWSDKLRFYRKCLMRNEKYV